MNPIMTAFLFSRGHQITEISKIETEKNKLENASDLWSSKMILDFIAGLIGGAAGVLVGHPLDTVKVHLQTDNLKDPKYKGTFHCLRTIFLQDGFRGLYRGISSPMSGIGFVNSIVFGIYGNVQRLAHEPDSLYSHFLAGSAAGVVQSIVCAPMELAKTRMQLINKLDSGVKFKSPLDCLKVIVRTEGIRGAFKGLTATIARDVPGFSSYFVSYEYLMKLKRRPNAVYTLVAGGFAGCASWLACYPIDVVKTCLQADGLGKDAKYTGFVDCSIKGYEKEGMHFFFRGLNSTLIRAFPVNAACFFVVSWILHLANSDGINMAMHSNKSISVMNMDNSQYNHIVVNEFSEAQLVSANPSTNNENLQFQNKTNQADQNNANNIHEDLNLHDCRYYILENEDLFCKNKNENITN